MQQYCELKKDCGIMNNSAFSDEVYPEGIVTFEENLKVILTSKTYKEFQRIKNKKVSQSSKDEVNNKHKLSLGIGSEIKVNECRCRNYNEKSINPIQDPFIFNINPEDFPVNLSESSSEDESDSTKKSTEKFPTIAATTQQSRAKSDYKSNNEENVGKKSVSEGSHGISRSHKRKLLRKVKERNLSDSSSEDESDSTKENTKKFPTVTANTQQSRTKSEYKNFNTEDVRIKSVSDGSNKRKLLLKMKERNSSYKKVATMKNNEKFPTITATSQQYRAKSECKSYNIENVGTMCACDESQYLENADEFPNIGTTTQHSRAKSQYKSSNTEDAGAKSVSDGSHLISRNNKRKKYVVQKGH